MKKNSSLFNWLIFSLFLTFSFLPVFSAQADVIANVNFDEKKVVFQEDNNFKINFIISNGEQSQTGVRYSVFVLDINKDNEILDEYVYEETLELASKSKIAREISYSAPRYLKGEYELVLQAQNKSGLVLAMGFLGKFEFFGDDKFVKISDCRLKIVGDKKVDGYDIYEGIDVLSNEDMILKCRANNNSGNDLELNPYFEVRERSPFGDIVDNVKVKKQSVILKSSENTSFEIDIPKHDIPQAYEIILILMDESKQVSSNKVNIHYVLRGESATIQNVSLDKSSYMQGEKAKISFFWSGSADYFPGSRIDNDNKGKTATNYKLTIVDEDGMYCVEPLNEKLGDEFFMTIERSIIKDCKNPVVYANISNDSGKIYDDVNFSFGANPEISDKEGSGELFSNIKMIKRFSILLFSILFIAVIVTILFKRKSSLSLFLLIISIVFFHSGTVMADVTDHEYDLYATGGIDKGDNGVYSPGENIIAHLSVRRIGCANYIYGGTGYGKLSTESSYTRFGSFNNLGSRSANLGTITKRAPSTPGNYLFNFRIDGYQNCTASGLAGGGHDCTRNKNADIEFSVPFRVVNSTVNCSCGSRSRNYNSSISNWPATDSWCSAGCNSSGVPSSFPNHGAYTAYWSCNSPNGGSNAINCRTGHRAPDPLVDLSINGSDGPVVVNRDNGDNLDISWDVNKNSSSSSITTTCSKSGSSWGNGQIIPPRPLNNADNNTLIPNPPYPVSNSPYALTCYNASSDSALNSDNVTDTVNVSVACNAGDSTGNCSRPCGDGTKTITHTNANCTTSISIESCNLGPCPAAVEFEEVAP